MMSFPGESERGFTLVEVMAAITVFTLMTLGLVPLFASSIKGTSISRSYTRGKNVAVEAMERARGVPFFIDYPTQIGYSSGSARKVDLLDLYFPAASSVDGGTYSAGTFTTVCTPASNNPACPPNLPAGYTVRFVAQFVNPTASGSVEQYTVQVPPEGADGYRWNPSPYAGQDQPPSQMLRLAVTVEWIYAGAPKSVEIVSIIGNRDFGEVTVKGSGKIDHLVQVTTLYTDSSTGQRTEVRGVAGSAQSEIETKSQSNAHQTVDAARIVMTNLPAITGGSAEELSPVEGAASSIHAPPDSTPTGTSVGPRLAVHDTFGTVAGIDGTTTSNLRVSVARELPTAQGSFGFSAPTGAERMFFLEGQVGEGSLRLDGSEGLLKFAPWGSDTLSGTTLAETTSVGGSSRRVLTEASASFGRLRLLSTNFIQGVISDVLGDAVHRSVVVVSNFDAAVSCRATGLSSTAAATKAWSAEVWFYHDSNNNDQVDGSYQRVIVGSGLSSDPLAQWGRNTANPVVYDAPFGERDIHLFETNETRGYLQAWSSSVGQTTEVLDNGRFTSAAINEALRIVTAPTDPLHPESSILVQIGKLGCEAQDYR